MKHTTLPLIGLVILGVTGCNKSDHHKAPDSEPLTVSVARPQVESITLSAEYPGYLTANKSVDVVGKVNGEIISKNYESGQPVTKGQVLFTISPSTYRNRLEEAQSALSSARSQLTYAQAHYEAVKKALEADAVSKMEVMQAESNFLQAQAQVKNAQATEEMARRNLSYCTVTAPISGMITADEISTGNFISGENAPVKLATIYDNTSLTANFAIEDQRFLDIINSRDSIKALGLDRIPLTFSEPLPHEYFGSLTYMAPTLTQSTGTMKLECKIDNGYGELRPGMYVKINLPYARLTDAILVNNASVVSDAKGSYVYVVNDSNRVVKTPVIAGEVYRDSLRIISAGLSPDARYVTRAISKVKSGMTVNPKE